MTKAGLLTAAISIAACGASTPGANQCLVNEDCPSDWFCEGPASASGSTCVVAQAGTCRPIDYSIVGMTCSDDGGCPAEIFYCSASLHECALNTCLSTGNDPIVCNHGQCPNSGGTIVECAPGCHAGTRNGLCRSCVCDACGPADGGA